MAQPIIVQYGVNMWLDHLIKQPASDIFRNVRYYGCNIVEFYTLTSARELIRRESNEVGSQNERSIDYKRV